MRIYEWTHINRWKVGFTIQVVEKNQTAARRKALEHLKTNNGNKYLMEKVLKEKPTRYNKGIQVIEEPPHESAMIETF